MNRVYRILATGGYSGYFPKAPGTFGSMVILFVYWMLPAFSPSLLGLVIVAMFLVGVWSATLMTNENNGQDSDPSVVVIDEMVGMLVAVFLLPKRFVWMCLAFLLFRLLDVVKPFPVNKLEAFPKGWGVMLDDVGAGLYANIILQILRGILRA